MQNCDNTSSAAPRLCKRKTNTDPLHRSTAEGTDQYFPRQTRMDQ